MTKSHRPIILLRVFQVFACVGTIPFVINTADVLLHPLSPPLNGTIAFRLVSGLIIAPLTLVIAFLCLRRVPNNLIGWLLIGFSYGASSQALRQDLLPLAPTILVSNLFVTIFWISYVLIPLYFPNGQLYPPRLNRWGNPILTILLLLLFFGTIPFSKNVVWESGETQLTAPNPLFIVEFDYNVFTIPLILAILITGAITLFLRYRDGVRQERLQLGWLLAGVICQFGLLILSTVLAEALNVDSKFVGALYSIIIPITITVALLRYRLYDIDLIIRRTVVYAILTAALGLVYFGSVVVLQTLIGQATEEQSPLVIVFSTLLIAALFSPLRRRIQAFIDRRFYRRKYDAAQTLARFAAAARDEVELEQLTGSIQLAIEQTLQPEGISIWLPKTNTKTH
jgi:hypothetical protein